jgi:hypothetical protein
VQQKAVYQFQCAVVVYIMADPGVFRMGWCSSVTNSRWAGQLMSNERSGVAGRVQVYSVVYPERSDRGMRWSTARW